MQAKIRVGMRLRVGRDLGDPRRRNHDARRRDGTLVERVEGRRVGGVGKAQIVGVEDQQL